MTTVTEKEYKVHLRSSVEHPAQDQFINSTFKRIIIKAGRRGGKTVGSAKKAVKAFLSGKRVLYAAPTSTQTDAFWYEVCKALEEPLDAGVFKKNETERFVELAGSKQRIKAKTAWNADTLRGDFADLLILDEFQMMDENAWTQVGQPMLLDNNGDAVFIFTPPSLQSAGISKAKDPRHASKMFREKSNDTTGLWETIHFTSHDNPFISDEALKIITSEMTLDAYRREIMAQDDDIEQSWLVYGMWNETLCKIKRFPIPKDWIIYSGHDFGSANPAALFIAQNSHNTAYMNIMPGEYVAYHEYLPGRGFSPNTHVDNWKDIVAGYRVGRSAGGNWTTEDDSRTLYTQQGWSIVPPKFSKINPQIAIVQDIIEHNKLHIFDDMTRLLFEFANCLWIIDEENKPTNKIQDEQKYHLSACLRYIGSYFPVEGVFNQGRRRTYDMNVGGSRFAPQMLARR